MSVYKKLSEARSKFHGIELKKTGHNKFAGYYYFELGDFLIPALGVFKDCGLLSVTTFDKDVAAMRVINIEKPDDFILFTSPFGSAALKGAHEIQNIGAVETYQRRYLWVAALEIVEHDALDATTGQDKPTMRHQPTGEPIVDQHRLSVIADVADAIKQHMAQNDVIGAYEEASGLTDPEERTALWKLLPAHIRSALKKQSDELKAAAGATRA